MVTYMIKSSQANINYTSNTMQCNPEEKDHEPPNTKIAVLR